MDNDHNKHELPDWPLTEEYSTQSLPVNKGECIV